jgi:endonuclease YncB( thermonuclease family)
MRQSAIMRRLVALLIAVAGAMPAAAAPACKTTPLATVSVAAVRDGRTLALKDGRELRLAAIEAGAGSRAALERLIGGQPLRLETLGANRDRYGRLVAFAYAGDATQTLQQGLLAAGDARVSARVGDKACADVLLKSEEEARKAHRGLWADPNFAPLQADNLLRLGSERGRFAVVEGKVLSVHASGATIYLNFGRYWTRDFSVIIPRRHQRSFTAAGLAPKTLEGRRVRVRGWLEQRRGPLIEADRPEQIEIID